MPKSNTPNITFTFSLDAIPIVHEYTEKPESYVLKRADYHFVVFPSDQSAKVVFYLGDPKSALLADLVYPNIDPTNKTCTFTIKPNLRIIRIPPPTAPPVQPVSQPHPSGGLPNYTPGPTS